MKHKYLQIFDNILKQKAAVGLERGLNSHVLIIDGL